MRAGFAVMTPRQSNNPPSGKARHQGQKRPDRWKAMSRAWSSFSLTSRGLCTKNLFQQAKLWIPCSTTTFCGDCVKTCKDVAPKFGEKRPGCFTMITPRLTPPSSPNSFWRKPKWLIPLPPCSPDLTPPDFFLFSKMTLKLKGRRFDTTEEIQAESQRVLDTLVEKDFQKAFQKWRRRWDRCLHAGENYPEGDGGR